MQSYICMSLVCLFMSILIQSMVICFMCITLLLTIIFNNRNEKYTHHWGGVLVCLDYSSLWSFPALSKSDVSIPTWNVFGTLITNLTRDLIHCMETARVSQAVLHVQHMWGKKTAREGQMDRSSGAWLRYAATTPDVLHLWIYGSHPHKTHRQWSQNRGWPALSMHKRHPPSTWPLHVSRWLNYSRRDS